MPFSSHVDIAGNTTFPKYKLQIVIANPALAGCGNPVASTIHTFWRGCFFKLV
jgi:hypothetical protein